MVKRRILAMILCAALALQPVSSYMVKAEVVSIGQEKHVPVLEIEEDGLLWNEDYGVDGYEIYCSVGSIDGTYSLVHRQSSEYTYYDFEDMQKGQKYYYKVRSYYEDEFYNSDTGKIENQIVYSEFSDIKEYVVPLDTVQNVKIKVVSYDSLEIMWDNLSDVEGYILQRSTQQDGEYQTIARIQGEDTVSYLDKKLVMGVNYFYRVYAYVSAEGGEVLSGEAQIVSGMPTLDKTSSVKSKCTKPTKLTMTWKQVKDAQGYVIYKTSADKMNWKKYKTIHGKKKTSLSFKVSNGKCYGVRIAAYRKTGGAIHEGLVKEEYLYGDYYCYQREDYVNRYKRVYGSKGEYTSEKEAQKNMKTIKVKVWDFAKGMSGKKVTKVKYITCNKAVAPTIMKIFQKIYKGKEKAPIYEVGCFSWRSGQHGQGLALDINADYNAMFDDGKAVVGKCWKPKKYAYSIKRNGDIENAMAEYGFERGFWGSRKDYMHFSYFGV